MASFFDRDALRQQYCTDELLRLRQDIHERFSVPRVDFPAWVLGRVQWRGNETVLDVGTGSGFYYKRVHAEAPDMRFVGLDSSLGMLMNHPAAPTLAQADATRLPFADGVFDVVMANHMLYHVADMDTAIAEMKRVLKPAGLLLTATNSYNTMPEFTALFRRAVMLLSNPGTPYTQPLTPVHYPYALENGARQLSRHFFAVVRYDLPQMLVFHTAEPALAYFSSWRSMREPLLPEEVRWDDVMLLMSEQIDRMLDGMGELVINKISGALVATDGGGFIAPYVALR
ncbi:MAG TPA: class I SAM-dependent methyltransferase [Candidatus Limnocylindrales bacterium]|nr:class I SAM-dependent methyltransferase [Candidatus Limnocylindrales bacterium]